MHYRRRFALANEISGGAGSDRCSGICALFRSVRPYSSPAVRTLLFRRHFVLWTYAQVVVPAHFAINHTAARHTRHWGTPDAGP